MVKFTKTEDALKTAEQFFEQFSNMGNMILNAEIKQYLVDHIIIVFYSEVEENLKNIVKAKWSEFRKTNFSSFFTKKDFMKRLDSKIQISKPLKIFGRKKLNISSHAKEAYTNFINRRHDIAHARAKFSEITWEEIKGSKSRGVASIAKVGEKVLSDFERLLNT